MSNQEKTKTELITDLKQLRSDNSILKQLIDKLPIGIIVADDNAKITLTNAAARAIFGESPEKNCSICHSDGSVCSPEDLPRLKPVKTGDRPEAVEIVVHKENEEEMFSVSGSPIFFSDSVTGAFAVITDADETKQMEEERNALMKDLSACSRLLVQEQLKLQTILDTLPVGVVIADKTGKMIKKNHLVNKIWGGNAPLVDDVAMYKKYVGWSSNNSQIIEADEWALARALHGETSFAEKIDIMRFDGTMGAILNSAAPVYDEQGRIAGGVAVIQDISYQRQLEQELVSHKQLLDQQTDELAHTNQKLTTILESITDGFFTLDKEWRYTYVNKTLDKNADLLGRNVWEVHPTLKDTEVGRYYMQVMEHRVPVQFEAQSIYYDDVYFDIEVSPYDNGICVFMKNITERKKYERELKRLSGLDLIAQMAAGISHEIRNPMATVRGYLQLLRDKSEFLKYEDNMDLMIEELDRANFIISEFLSMGNQQPTELKKQNLCSIVKAIAPLIEADAIRQNIYLQLDLKEVPDLYMNCNEIRQLLLNLSRNGLEEMTRGQWLTISTFCEENDVILAVKDQGKGIEPDVLEKLGTPFFTTKKDGTGLGLGICYSIAARHNAEIEINTGTEGTVFYVKFKIDANI